MAECRGGESTRGKEVKCAFFCFFVVFFPQLSCHATFLYFFFPQLGQSCCGLWCRVPRAWQRNSNMDHLTPVKTGLLVERQALSARRAKVRRSLSIYQPPPLPRLSKASASRPPCFPPAAASPTPPPLPLGSCKICFSLELIYLDDSLFVSLSRHDTPNCPLCLCPSSFWSHGSAVWAEECIVGL